ncbi:unnamed protein product [Meloidogyne enterolobii]|uniref:Uncharacterized protein n=1 Tax=Meloidogyne enterolobii TaxID=390850 RepID=A0ACB0YAW5_MELEN
MGSKFLLGNILAFGMCLGIVMSTNCPAPLTNTRNSESNSNSQAHRECNIGPLCDCYATTTPGNAPTTSTAAASTSTAASLATGSSGVTSNATSGSQAPVNVTISSATQSASSFATSSSTSGSCPCLLVTELRRIKFLRLNFDQQNRFEVCIKQIEIDLADVTLTLSVKVIRSVLHLKKCFANNTDIEPLVTCETIDKWGRVFEFIIAGFSFCSDNMKLAITPVDNIGNTPLTAAIENATANDKCGNGTTAIVLTWTKWFKRVCIKNDDDWPMERKIAYHAVVLRQYCANAAPSCVYLNILQAKINLVGIDLTVEDFLFLCDPYTTLSSIGNAMLSGDADSNPTLKSLNNSINSNATAQNYNSSTIAEANNYVSTCYSYFKIENDPFKRLKFLSAQFSYLSSLAHTLCYLTTIIGNGFQCPYSQIIGTSHICTNNNVTVYNQTVPQDYAHCFKPDKNNNTEVMQAIDLDLKPLLTSVQIMSLNSYRNAILNCIYKLYPNDCVSAYQCSFTYIKNCFTSNGQTQPRALFMNTFLWTVFPPPQTVSQTIIVGTFSGSCGCNSK